MDSCSALPTPILFFALVALLGFAFLRFTKPGRFVYAIGDNPAAARISGAPVRPIIVLQYAISATIAYLAGMITATAVASMNTNVANSSLIYDVILVVVLGGIGLSGGRGGIRNVIVGTLLIGILLNGMTIMNIEYTLQNVIRSSDPACRDRHRQHHQSTRRTDRATRRHLELGRPRMEEMEHEEETIFSRRSGIAMALSGMAGHAIAAGMDDPRRAEYFKTFEGKTIAFVPTLMGIDLTEGWASVMKEQADRLGMKFEIRDPHFEHRRRRAGHHGPDSGEAGYPHRSQS